MAAQLGWVREPVICFARAASLDPSDADARVLLGQALLAEGDLVGAERALEEALALVPRHPDGAAALGKLRLARGDLDGAEALIAGLPKRTPSLALVWAEICRARGGPQRAIEPLRESLRSAGGMAKVRLLHSLGDTLDAAGDIDAAFDAYVEANSLRTAEVSAQAILGDAQARIDACPVAPEPVGPPSRRPVWIVGLPRSGTTLVEQILAAHPAVAAGGERTVLRDLEIALRKGLPAQVLADRLHRSLSEVGGELPLRVTDKMPDNAHRLDLAYRLAPGSTVICVRRDPLDTLWSCFRQCFGDGLAWSTRPEGLRAALEAHERLIAHWRSILPVTWIDLRYEDLVREPEASVRGLLDGLDLPFDPRCCRPHEVSRRAATASASQVRQPLHAGWVGRSGPYRDKFSALLEGSLRA